MHNSRPPLLIKGAIIEHSKHHGKWARSGWCIWISMNVCHQIFVSWNVLLIYNFISSPHGLLREVVKGCKNHVFMTMRKTMNTKL
jgi:hypothetical protein